jgi:hypothetical protein
MRPPSDAVSRARLLFRPREDGPPWPDAIIEKMAGLHSRKSEPAMDRTTRILQSHYKKTVRDGGHGNLLFLPNEENNRECFLLVVGLSYPNIGETIIQLLFDEGFPQKPPGFRCLTECGTYDVGPRICISIGEYHDTDRRDASQGAWGYFASLGVLGFAREIMNGIISSASLNLVKHRDSMKGGIGIKDTPAAETARLAIRSSDYNRKNNAVLRQKFLDLAKANPDLKAAKAWLQQIAREDIIRAPPSAGAPSPAQFDAAFGPELRVWIESTFPCVCPGVEGALHLAGAPTLAYFVPNFTKPFVAYLVLSVVGVEAQKPAELPEHAAAANQAAWKVLEECAPGLYALKDLLAPTGFLADKNAMSAALQYLWASFTTDFAARDALVGRLRAHGKASPAAVGGWEFKPPR